MTNKTEEELKEKILEKILYIYRNATPYTRSQVKFRCSIAIDEAFKEKNKELKTLKDLKDE